jgi:hypothetical protein
MAGGLNGEFKGETLSKRVRTWKPLIGKSTVFTEDAAFWPPLPLIKVPVPEPTCYGIFLKRSTLFDSISNNLIEILRQQQEDILPSNLQRFEIESDQNLETSESLRESNSNLINVSILLTS